MTRWEPADEKLVLSTVPSPAGWPSTSQLTEATGARGTPMLAVKVSDLPTFFFPTTDTVGYRRAQLPWQPFEGLSLKATLENSYCR